MLNSIIAAHVVPIMEIRVLLLIEEPETKNGIFATLCTYAA